jgi:hypothetical protein
MKALAEYMETIFVICSAEVEEVVAVVGEAAVAVEEGMATVAGMEAEETTMLVAMTTTETMEEAEVVSSC